MLSDPASRKTLPLSRASVRRTSCPARRRLRCSPCRA